MDQPIPFRTTTTQSKPIRASWLRQQTSLWLLCGRPFKEVTRRIWTNVLEDDLTGRSAQLAYYFFLSLFPGMIFVSAMIGLVAGSNSNLSEHMLDSFGTFLPPAAYKLVVSTFTEILTRSSAGKAAIGIVFALWSATSGMSAMQDTLNCVFREKETRPLWRSTLVALVLTIAVFFMVLIAIIAFFYGGALVEFLSFQLGLSAGLTFIWKLAQWPIAILFLSIAIAVIYHFAPDTKQRHFRWITPGSVIGILGWMGASGLFRAYLHFFNRYSVTYGSLGAVIILLLWFYFSGFTLLLGAEVNAAIEQCAASAAGVPKLAPAPPVKKFPPDNKAFNA